MNPRRGPEGLKTRWLGRLLRGMWPDRNPLRRGWDRAETVILGLLLTAFLAGAPFAAHAAASWAYASSAREAQLQAAALREVPATLLQTAPAWNGYASAPGAAPEVTARWRTPDGQAHTGKLYVPSGAAAGTTVPVYIDQAGQLVGAPLQHTQVVNRAELTGALAVAGLALTLIVAGWLTRRALDRRRMAAWDADWLATGPRWSPRR